MGAASSGESIFNLKSKWTSQDGKTLPLDSLKGRPAVIAMSYTSCQKSCPLIVADMKKIEDDLSKKHATLPAFVLFSFDSKRDTPERLKNYAETRKLDQKKWTLFHGDPKAVRELAAVLGIRYKADAQGDFDHSNLITLLDSEGVIQFQLKGLGQDPESLEQRLAGERKLEPK